MPTPADLRGGYVYVRGGSGGAPPPVGAGVSVADIADAMSDVHLSTIYVVRALQNVQRPARPPVSKVSFGSERRGVKGVAISILDKLVCDEHTRCAIHFAIGGAVIIPRGHCATIVSERSAMIERSTVDRVLRNLDGGFVHRVDFQPKDFLHVAMSIKG